MTERRPRGSDLKGILTLSTTDDATFEGLSPDTGFPRIFGGQVLAQSLVAGQRTISDLAARPVHSFHAHFLRPGNPDVPIRFDVETIRDGRSFSTRHVRATQGGKGILLMTVSAEDREEGFEHQLDMPQVTSPEEIGVMPDPFLKRLEQMPEEMRKRMMEPRPVELRFVTERQMHNPVPGDPEVLLWFRAADWLDLGTDPALHQAVLAYASDMTFMDTALVPHGSSLMDPNVHGVSLDHSVWFHEEVNMKDWHLFVRESPWARHSRGFVRGFIYNRQGTLVASVIQECLIRRLPDKS